MRTHFFYVWEWLLLLIFFSNFHSFAQTEIPAPTLNQIIDSNRDIITDYAIARPDGPTYESILPLMTPVRWSTAEFRHFPVLLSAPSSTVKGRMVSNGSALNPFANFPPTWKEAGRSLHIFLDHTNEPFGQKFDQTSEGLWLDGWKPAWNVSYSTSKKNHFLLEVFAPVEPLLAAQGALCFRLLQIAGQPTIATIRLDAFPNQQKLEIAQKSKPALKSPEKTQPDQWIQTTRQWTPKPEDPLTWSTQIKPGESAIGILFTKPTSQKIEFLPSLYDNLKSNCIRQWEKHIAQCAAWEIPEERIQNAWKAHFVSILMTISGKNPNYSAINAYDHLYMTEGSDLLRGLAYWGAHQTVNQVIDSQFAFQRTDTRTAVAGLKLILLRDLIEILQAPDILTNQEHRWQPVLDFIQNNLSPENGLPPPDRFAGDISGAVYNLRSSALCWKGLSDLSIALNNSGRNSESKRISMVASQLNDHIMKALKTSESLSTDPDFVPIGFFGKDKPVTRIPDTQESSYYNLVLGNVIDSGILDQQRENRVFRYLDLRAGLSMGMPRTRPFWKNSPYYGQDGIAPLYGLKYAQARLRRDQPDHAIVTLYGWLAHGMTRDSCIHGEGVRYSGGDANGRFFHLPPNSTSAANWLTLLRFLMIQEWDLDHNGQFETLRLLDATPRQWLSDGKTLRIQNAPSRFGPISIHLQSQLQNGFVEIQLQLPKNRPESTSIRIRLPKPYQAFAFTSENKTYEIPVSQRIDLSKFHAETVIKIKVQVRSIPSSQ